MKTITLILFTGLLSIQIAAQVRAKAIAPEELEDKVLYIPDYNEDDPIIQRWERKGKDDKISAAQEYAQLWDRVMASSSWDATPYKIKKFETKKLIKEKNPEALLLSIYARRTRCGDNDYVINYYASILMTGPKKKYIATALINNLDWYEDNDLRLIVNMLSNDLNEAMEAHEDGGGKSSKKAAVMNYKKNVVDFVGNIEDKTFLVQRAAMRDEDFEAMVEESGWKDGKINRRRKKHERLKEKDADVEAAMKESWKLCSYKMQYEDEIVEKRTNLEPNYFFWLNIPLETCSPLAVGTNKNHIFSTEGDKVLASYAGKGKMKPATVDNIQKKLMNRYNKFKKQLEK